MAGDSITNIAMGYNKKIIAMKKYLKFISHPIKSIKEQIAFQAATISKEKINQLTSAHYLIPIDDREENDIYIVGYPKSGNTWMQFIVSCIKYGINPDFLSESLAQELVPDIHARKYYKRYSPQMAFKAHSLPNKIMKQVIYIVRDGRDVLASYYGMYQSMGISVDVKKMVTKGDFLNTCKWHEHISSWKKNPYNAKILVIKYENLISNPITELQKISFFLNIKQDDSFLTKVADGNTFEKIKNKAIVMGTAKHFFDQHADGHKFYRKGKVGSFKEDIPDEVLEIFQNESFQELSELGYI